MNVEINQTALAEFRKQLTPIKACKIIFGTLISVGATAAVVAAMSNPLKASKGLLKVLMAAGVFVLACKAGDMAQDHFEQTVDNLSESIQDISKEMKEIEEELKKGENNSNGNNPDAGRDSKQQPEKQRSSAATAAEGGKAAGASVRRRWWSKKEGDAQVLEVDEKNVPERQKSEGDHEGRGGKPDRSGGQG